MLKEVDELPETVRADLPLHTIEEMQRLQAQQQLNYPLQNQLSVTPSTWRASRRVDFNLGGRPSVVDDSIVNFLTQRRATSASLRPPGQGQVRLQDMFDNHLTHHGPPRGSMV